MAFKIERKPFHIGASQAITLPSAWCSYYADRIDLITILGSEVLILAPKGLENVAQSMIERLELQRSDK
jgi:hypothetical protein